ncbi:hypothetical protein MSAN_01177700 [Mycena sanguinolenta]|uniref:Uncharacterized protein n=1 Tax=Mycena sanguinolenta TaxID=230812 RepID=A0A8H6YNF0_9AGAR|nr:hypothetical protein MSAN_01177700 [Mycena sanguinolenta]
MLATNRVHASNPPLAPLTSIISPKHRVKSTQFDPPSFFFPTGPSSAPLRRKSRSSPSFAYTLVKAHMPPDSEGDSEDEDAIYTARRTPALRTRLFGGRSKADTISTTPGHRGAGETETELDEPARSSLQPLWSSASPHSSSNSLAYFRLSLLYLVLSIIFTLYTIPPSGLRAPERVDYFVSALWAILTGYQCLALTTGLLTRWRVYYPPLATLIRLLALQAICWPATHLSLTLLDHTRRPAAVWAAIGTTTCMSRSVQIWVTSNLWWEQREGASLASSSTAAGKGGTNTAAQTSAPPTGAGTGGWRRFGGRWGGRRWDWREVAVQCMLPAGVLYFVMAWAEQLRREWSGC